MIYLVLCIIALQIFFLLIKIRLRIVKRDDFNVDLILSQIFNIRIDLDENDSSDNNNQKESFGESIRQFLFYWEERDFFKALARRSWVNKVTLIQRRNIDDPVLNVYWLFLQWQLLSLIQALIDRYFVFQKNRYYQVIYKEKESNKRIVLEIEVETRIFYLIYLLVRYPKSTSKVLFPRKERSS
ncbi:MAG: hypothetical protein ACOX5P_06735 [Bacilli bacterium]|jgi:hypothetical protein|nr:MAG: hypothetical protein BWX94_00373 [Tenericutes bacterium ADurb.Bin140]HON63895.1 hypothetical protein [Bacilli bacterium]